MKYFAFIYGTLCSFQVEGGPNPPEEDLNPVKGNITFPPGGATVVYNLTVLDDEVGDVKCLRGQGLPVLQTC